ncbi:DUF2330 domain-containing protein [Ruania suaedae]|uniref:DUF2330 domain-containing protein n=1 Tax=Ruania suaedae TaxID=2897774 RepID=UPI001E3B0191|nr:DUF2330 domain-containing protein [Ruania suaedae]UFU02904.1 DUF2330 domain-containing protein [Ruania suaedae]
MTTLRGPRTRGSSLIRRTVATAGLALGLTSGLVLVPEPAEACGCGAAVAEEGYDIAVGREEAVVAWDGETEQIVLQLDMLSQAPEGALLIPTPSPAEVELADPAVFARLEQMIAPRVEVDYRWWPESGAGGASADEASAAGSTVDVMSSVTLGPLEVSVLSASDADGLSEWLDAHDYVMGDAVAEALLPYVSEGWFYVAVRIDPDSQALDGEIQPLHLTFDSMALLYPMRISAAATQEQFVRTYVVTDQQVQRTDPTWDDATGERRYAGPLEQEAGDETLSWLATEGAYLTVFDQRFTDPGEQIVSDFTFAPAPEAGDHREVAHVVRMREILGLPAGPVLVGLGGAGVFIALVVLAVVRGRRAERGASGA